MTSDPADLFTLDDSLDSANFSCVLTEFLLGGRYLITQRSIDMLSYHPACSQVVKLGKRGVSIMSTIVLASMLLVIPTLGRGVVLFVSLMAAALAFAFRQGPLQALATELVPRRSRGALVAARNTASQIGIAIATLACGQLYDHLGYQAVGLFSGIVTMGAAVCIFMMREPATGEPAA